MFVRTTGVRADMSPVPRAIERALNKLAKERYIVDANEDIFHFNNHAFRYTKAVELITSPEFINEFEEEINKTKNQIDRAKALGRNI